MGLNTNFKSERLFDHDGAREDIHYHADCKNLNGNTVKLREACLVFKEHESCSEFDINKTCGNCSFIARE
jgi:hypothetical protein